MRATARERDVPALLITAAIVMYSAFIVLLPVSDTVRRLAEMRFHLSGWPLGAWVMFQPLPSMYNFENQWTVTFSRSSPVVSTDACPETITGYINHHVYNRLLLPGSRLRLERCGLPALVRFTSTYRGTTINTTYVVRHGPGEHGLTVTSPPDQ
jgi:hypothetical protein